MTIYYLYIKTHNKTGLKYLGKTKQSNPHAYRGSGKDWVAHLKEHGNDVTTTILKECKSNEEVRTWGIYYSDLWNVVKSDEWANNIPETGGGFGLKPGTVRSEEAKKNIAKGLTGIVRSDETRRKISESQQGVKRGKYKPRSEEHANKIAGSLRGKKQSNEHRLAKSNGMRESWARRKAAKGS